MLFLPHMKDILFQSSAPLYLKFFFLTKDLYREGSPKGPTSYLFYTILDRKENRFEYLEPTWQDKKVLIYPY